MATNRCYRRTVIVSLRLNIFQLFPDDLFPNRLWSDPNDNMEPDSMSKDVFRRLSIFRNRLVEFGLEAEPLFPKYCAQNQDECA